MSIEIILIYLFIAALLLSIAYASYYYAPWLPTRSRDISRVLRLADLKEGERFYDLGCGTGKTVFAAAKCNGVCATGIELVLPLYVYCRVKNAFKKNSRADFVWGDFFRKDLSKADVVYLFATPRTMQGALQKKLFKELKPGSRIISYSFEFINIQPDKVSKPTENDLPIRLYIT